MTTTESLATSYNQNCDFQVDSGMKVLSLLNLQDNMKVLDLGCGTGQLSRMIADQLDGGEGKVVAVDPDKERLKIARETYGCVGNLMFENGQADSIPGCDYDAVFSNYVFHWIKDKETAFQSVYRSLKPSGLFAGTFIATMSKFVLDYINLLEPNHFSRFKNELFYETPDEIEKIALSCGFSVRYKKVTELFSSHSNFDEFTQFMYAGYRGIVDPKLMDAEKLQEFKEKVGDGDFEYSMATVAFFVFEKM